MTKAAQENESPLSYYITMLAPFEIYSITIWYRASNVPEGGSV